MSERGMRPGIPQYYLERFLFRPFQSTKPRGLTLGLYHAKAIVEGSGGTIEVANRGEGQGARVAITLPGVQEGAQVPPRSPRENGHVSA